MNKKKKVFFYNSQSPFFFSEFRRVLSGQFGSSEKVKMLWFTDLVLFLAFCNKAHMLNKPSKGKQ